MEKHEMSFVSAAHVIKARGRGRGRQTPPPGFTAAQIIPHKRRQPWISAGEKWDKIRLENVIFHAAARKGLSVAARQGCLCCAGGGKCLQKLLAVYNRFFSAENRKSLREEIALEKREYALFIRLYRRARKENPPFRSFHLSEQKHHI